MLDLGIEQGVRLQSVGYLYANNAPIAKRIDVDKATADSYSAYIRECPGGAAHVEQLMQRHVEQYMAYRGTQFRKKTGTGTANQKRLNDLRHRLRDTRAAESQAESKKWHEFAVGTVPSWWSARGEEGRLEDNIDQLEAELEAAEKDAQRLAESDSAIAVQAYALERAIERGENLVAKNGSLILVLEKHRWMLDAWKRTASPAVIEFFDNFVHDSRTDFLGGAEPFVYFRNRGIHEQARQSGGSSGSW